MEHDTDKKLSKRKLSALAWALGTVLASVSGGVAAVSAQEAATNTNLESVSNSKENIPANVSSDKVAPSGDTKESAVVSAEVLAPSVAEGTGAGESTVAQDAATAATLSETGVTGAGADTEVSVVEGSPDSVTDTATETTAVEAAQDVSAENEDVADADTEADAQDESFAEQTQEVVSDLLDSVWTDESAEEPKSNTYSTIVDPFAKQQSGWIDVLLGNAISDAQAAKDEQSFNFFIATDTSDLSTISSGLQLSELVSDKLPKLSAESLLQEDSYKQDFISSLNRGFSYTSYLFHQNNPYRSRYKIPVLFLNDQGAQDLLQQHSTFTPFAIGKADDQVAGNLPIYVVDRRYDNEACHGLGILEADLLGKCFYSERNDLNLGALVIPSIPESIEYEGIYTGIIRHITPNVMQLNALTTGIETASRLAGINSKLTLEQVTLPAEQPAETAPAKGKGKKQAPPPAPKTVLTATFPQQLGSFEQHLYSTKLQDFVKPSQKFQNLNANCNMNSQKECGLYFVGQDVQLLLSRYAGANFNLGQSILLPQFEAESAESFLKSNKAADGTSFYVPLDKYGSGRYTLSSMDLAQIYKARSKGKDGKEVSSKDAMAIAAMQAPSANKKVVEIEPASLEMRHLVAESMNAATRTIGGKLPAEYIDEMRGISQDAQENQDDSASAEQGAVAEGNGDMTAASETNAAEVQATEVTAETSEVATNDAATTDNAKVSDKAAVVANSETPSATEPLDPATEAAKAGDEQALASVAPEANAESSAEKFTEEVEKEDTSLSASIALALAENSGVSSDGKDKVKPAPDIKAEYGIPVYFNEMGMPSLGLRNTILSYGDYKNYNFLTELEMMVLSDLGYSIESAEFFGASIYSQGRPDQRYAHNIVGNFGLYDHKAKSYDVSQPSIMPSAVGLHVYGDYNDIAHSSTYNIAGVGGIGVRVDGCDNYYYQQSNSVIEVSGVEGSGVAFTYGKNNNAYIGGKIVANGSKGVAIRADMGSNINSDLVEYRGSYVRARSLDYIEGRLTQKEAAAVPLLEELNGPQVQHLTIAGQIEGSRAAIYIDESSLVRNINVSSSASIVGGIYSIWNPSIDGVGNIKVKHDSRRSKLLDAFIQYPIQDTGETMREMAVRELTTNLNLGVKLNDYNQVSLREAHEGALYDDLLEGDPKSRAVIDGSVNGGSIKIRQLGGKNVINGDVRAYEIEVFEGVLKLTATENAIHQLNQLKLRPYAVLDLVDGKGSQTFVQEETYFGSNATVRVDVDIEGNVLDQLTYMGQLHAEDYQLRVEPAVSYETLKSLASNPKTMLNFVTNFMQKTNEHLASSEVSLRFPRYIWDAAGSYGREIKCGAKGCRVGGFVSNEVVSKFDNIQPWRYYLSFGGCLLFIVGFYLVYFFKTTRKKNS